MAFRENFSSPSTAEVFKDGIFNIDQAVGANEVGTKKPAANRPTDMMLIYYFLFVIYRDGDKLLFPTKPGDDFRSPDKLPAAKNYNSSDTKLKIGGLVERFQTDMKKNGRSVFVDGRCDRGRGLQTTITQSVYTIHLLNFHYAKTIKVREKRDDWQAFLINDPLASTQLRQELAASSFG